CCLAFAVSSFISSEDSAQPIIQATVLPLYFISGVLVPASQLSKPLSEVASVLARASGWLARPRVHVGAAFFLPGSMSRASARREHGGTAHPAPAAREGRLAPIHSQ